jgi:multidrug resistance efflux pump
LKRQEVLFNQHWIVAQTLDEMRANASIAKAERGVAKANRDQAAHQIDLAAATVERIKTLLAYTQIVAPFDGVVARRLVNRGDLVQAPTASRTTPLFTVQRIDTIRVFCDVPENDDYRRRRGTREQHTARTTALIGTDPKRPAPASPGFILENRFDRE